MSFLILNWQLYLMLSVINGVLLTFYSLKFVCILQQCGYNYKNFFKWKKQREKVDKIKFLLLHIISAILFYVINICFYFLTKNNFSNYIGFCCYMLIILISIFKEKKVNYKVPLKITKRVIRLLITYFIILTFFSCVFLLLGDLTFNIFSNKIAYTCRYFLICLLPLFTLYLLFLAKCINEPIEILMKKYYIKRAKKKLSSLNIIKIGITGSYAKTSSKEILTSILSVKFKVLATKKSYNTPLGIAITAKELSSDFDIFIAEMGARKVGDIKELSQIVKPNIAIITGVNNQHLESFLSIYNTVKTKYELVENLSPFGKAFFSNDNIFAKEMYEKFNGEKYLAGLNSVDALVSADNIVMGEKGTTFDLIFPNDKKIKCSTVLLGKHNISNICLASSVAFILGLNIKEIAMGINNISPIKHRLELIENDKKVTIIDDTYNSNEDGISCAMEVLSLYVGRKIVITPGLIELGKKEREINYNLGKMLSRYADKVIIVGKYNLDTIKSGLIENNFDTENIFFAKNLSNSNEILSTIIKKGDIILFENDLPDNYT